MINILGRVRLKLTNLILPIMRLISKLGKPEPLCSYQDYQLIKSKIQPGDILLSKENWRLSNLLIFGFWSHAAIAIDDFQVLEATPPKVRSVHLSQFVMSKDHIAHLRPKFDIKYTNHVDFYVNDDYDFKFLSGNEQWYCSEMVFDYLKRCNPLAPIKPRLVFGLETSTPDDFFANRDQFEIIYANTTAKK